MLRSSICQAHWAAAMSGGFPHVSAPFVRSTLIAGLAQEPGSFQEPRHARQQEWTIQEQQEPRSRQWLFGGKVCFPLVTSCRVLMRHLNLDAAMLEVGPILRAQTNGNIQSLSLRSNGRLVPRSNILQRAEWGPGFNVDLPRPCNPPKLSTPFLSTFDLHWAIYRVQVVGEHLAFFSG